MWGEIVSSLHHFPFTSVETTWWFRPTQAECIVSLASAHSGSKRHGAHRNEIGKKISPEPMQHPSILGIPGWKIYYSETHGGYMRDETDVVPKPTCVAHTLFVLIDAFAFAFSPQLCKYKRTTFAHGSLEVHAILSEGSTTTSYLPTWFFSDPRRHMDQQLWLFPIEEGVAPPSHDFVLLRFHDVLISLDDVVGGWKQWWERPFSLNPETSPMSWGGGILVKISISQERGLQLHIIVLFSIRPYNPSRCKVCRDFLIIVIPTHLCPALCVALTFYSWIFE